MGCALSPPAVPPPVSPPYVRRGALPAADVAERIRCVLADGRDQEAWRWLLQLTDDFRASSPAGRRALVARAPELVGDGRYDAALAALVEHLCAEADAPVPRWTDAPGRFAEPWWFPADLEGLRAAALRDSPISFKRHGVFVTANAWNRA